MDVLQSLRSISSYPIPLEAIKDAAEGVGLGLDNEITPEIREGNGLKKAKAILYFFLAEAPNVSQGGISYSFSEDERRRFRLRAECILDEIGEDGGNAGIEYGYKGENL